MRTVDPECYFRRDYQASRRMFLDAAARAGLPVETIRHPLAGPDGAELATDAVRIGPMDAEALLVLTSGMHGVELYCGAMCQAALLDSGRFDELPDSLAVLLIHAINPWGSAHGRRVTENNVDPCRNFVDFAVPLPENNGYAALHPHVMQAGQPGDVGRKARAELDRLREYLGEGAYNAAQFGGQYRFPDGVFYGGTAPEWTNRTMAGLLHRHGGNARRIATLDVHSGVGPWAKLLGVVIHSGAGLGRARRWYGDIVIAPNDPDHRDPAFYPVTGHSSDGYEAALPDAEVTALVLEYGTYPLDSGERALAAEHWLHVSGSGVSDAERQAIKAALAEHFNPDDAGWRRAVWDSADQIVGQALAGLLETA
jgi:hypothetical protein